MQEDDFLNQYREAWHQDAARVRSEAEVPTAELHRAIARHERRRLSLRIALWSGSAAACAALLLAVLLPRPADVAVPAEPLLAVCPPPAALPLSGDSLAPQPASALPADMAQAHPVSIQPFGEVAEAPAFQPLEALPPQPPLADTAIPVLSPRYVVTDRLVAMGESEPVAPRIVITDRLVHIEPHTYNTFREAVVEPILALVTKDLD